jgi:hypothetical protein
MSSIHTRTGIVIFATCCCSLSLAFLPLQTRHATAVVSMTADSFIVSSISGSSSTSSSKYPTARGSEVDSRKIIATEFLTAVRVNHILFASRDMAVTTLQQLRSAALNFEELATQLSNCDATRIKGGEVGWVAIHEDDGINDHLDGILPTDARVEVLELSTKVRL